MCGCCGCIFDLSLCEDTDLLLLRLRLQQLVLLIIWRHLHHFLFLVDSVPPVLLPALLQQSHSDGTRKESQLVQLGEYSLVVFTWSHDPSPSHSHFYQGHKNREFLRRVKKNQVKFLLHSQGWWKVCQRRCCGSVCWLEMRTSSRRPLDKCLRAKNEWKTRRDFCLIHRVIRDVFDLCVTFADASVLGVKQWQDPWWRVTVRTVSRTFDLMC